MIVSYNSKELDLLARIMRAEALNEGELGMLMVGNVVINRVNNNLPKSVAKLHKIDKICKHFHII